MLHIFHMERSCDRHTITNRPGDGAVIGVNIMGANGRFLHRRVKFQMITDVNTLDDQYLPI